MTASAGERGRRGRAVTTAARISGPASVRGHGLPAGFAIRLDRSARWVDGGRALVGGDPPRLIWLRPAARALIDPSGLVRVTGGPGGRMARVLLDAGLAHPDVALAGSRPGAAAGYDPQDVTVVVPVRDRPAGLGRLLAALDRRCPVIVVDDGSRDGATGAVAAAHGARLYRHPHSLGPAAARNTGLAAVGTPLVAFLDSDVVPCAGWLETVLGHFADPLVGVVAPRIVADEDPVAGPGSWLARYERVRSALDLGPHPALVLPRGRVAYLPSAALVARIEAIGGGFDPGLRVGEDVDLVWRVVRAGHRVRYEPAARVAHDHRTRLGPWLARRAAYGTSAAPLAARHPAGVPPVVMPPSAALVWLLLLCQRRWALGAAAAVLVASAARFAARLPVLDRPRWSRVALAGELVPAGVAGAGRQVAGALTRHWWPVVLPLAIRSRRLRRAVLVAAVADALADHRRTRSDLDPVRYLVARRLDDLGYGAGLWWGCLRHRTIDPLLPRRPRSRPVRTAEAVRSGRRAAAGDR